MGKSCESILIIGVGELGYSVLQAILTHPHLDHRPLTVLIRDPGDDPKAPKRDVLRTLLSLNISPIYSDISASSVADLAAIFKDFHTIVSCAGFSLGRGSALKVAQAVLEAGKLGGAKRFLPWQFGVDYDVIGRGSAQDLFDEQLDVRDLLRSQGKEGKVEWVVVSTGMFTSFLFEESFGIVEGPSRGRSAEDGAVVVRALGSWETEVTVTSPEDIGRVVAEVVVDEEVKNEIIYTAGETLSYGRLAALVEELSGKAATKEVWTAEYLEGELKKEPQNMLRKYRVVFAHGKGVAWDAAGTFDKKKEMGLADVKEWAKANWEGSN